MTKFEIGDEILVVKVLWRPAHDLLGVLGTIVEIVDGGYIVSHPSTRYYTGRTYLWRPEEITAATELAKALYAK